MFSREVQTLTNHDEVFEKEINDWLAENHNTQILKTLQSESDTRITITFLYSVRDLDSSQGRLQGIRQRKGEIACQ
jgi:hypothetical protein